MEDDIRTVGHQLAARILARNVERVGVDLAEKTRGRLRRHDVDQRELVDRLAVEPALVNDPRGQLAADHARRAGNENVHCVPTYSIVIRKPPMGPARSGRPDDRLHGYPGPMYPDHRRIGKMDPGLAFARPGWGGG